MVLGLWLLVGFGFRFWGLGVLGFWALGFCWLLLGFGLGFGFFEKFLGEFG